METRSNFLLALGVGTILLWALYIPDLFPLPFGQVHGIGDMVDELYNSPAWDMAGFKGKSKAEVEGKLLVELQGYWILSVLSVVLGIISGVCLVSRRRHCKIFVIAFASIMLCLRIAGHLEHYPDIGRSLYLVYVYMIQWMPFKIIRNDIITPAIQIITIIALTRPSIAKQFK